MESQGKITFIVFIIVSIFISNQNCSLAQDNNDVDATVNDIEAIANDANATASETNDEPQSPFPNRTGDMGGGRGGARNGRGGIRGGDRGGRGGIGGRRSPGRAPFWGFGDRLTEEEIDQAMKNLQERDPERAKQLEESRKTLNPEEFLNELRRYAGPEIGIAIYNSTIDRSRQDFIDWLQIYVPEEWEDLMQTRDNNPGMFRRRFESTYRKWRSIFDRARDNPELSKVLVADLKLMERQIDLERRIRFATDEDERNQLISDLGGILADRYDLSVIQEEIKYDQFLEKLKELQQQINDSLAVIEELKKDEVKAQIIENQIKERTESEGGLRGRRLPF